MLPPSGPGADSDNEQSSEIGRIRAEDIVRQIATFEASTGQTRPLARRVLRFTDTDVIGALDLPSVELSCSLEFVACRFEVTPNLRQARLTSCEFNRCWLPGLDGRGLRSTDDVRLVDCRVVGTVDLTDGDVGGSLDLRGSRLGDPDGDAVRADRLRLAGSLLGANVDVAGPIRISGLRTGGNVEFAGASLHGPLDAKGAQVGGSLLCTPSAKNRFRSTAPVLLSNARIGGDLSLRGAMVTAADDSETEQYGDAGAAVVADRVQVSGIVDLTEGFESTGTVRMVNAHVGDSIRLVGATIDLSAGWEQFVEARGESFGVASGPGPYAYRALHLAGTLVDGDIDGRDARIAGQMCVVDLYVRGSVILDGARLSNRNGDVVAGRRITVGGNFAMRGATVFGSMLLPEANIGADLDLRTSRFLTPGQDKRTLRPTPSIDLQAARIAQDLVCAGDVTNNKPFVAHDEIRVRRAQVGRQVTFQGAVLGTQLYYFQTRPAIDAFALIAHELRLDVAVPVEGGVNLKHARVSSWWDNDAFWNTTGFIELDDFRYDTIGKPIKPYFSKQVKRHLSLLHKMLRYEYRPSAYDQFAAMLRTTGNEEHAATVQIAKQRLRYEVLADSSYRVLGPLMRLWSLLQRWVVGYGFRPTRAFGALVLLAAAAVGLIATQGSGVAGVRVGLTIVIVVLGCILLGTVVAGVGHRLADFATFTSSRAIATALAPVPFSHELRSTNQARALLPPPVPSEPDGMDKQATAVGEQSIAVEAYLDTEDPLVARATFAALDDLVEILGYERPEQESVQRGSWWRRTTAKLKTWMTSDEIAERRVKVERALELMMIDSRQAEVDVRTAETVTRLIASLENVPQACLRAGSVLVVKYQGDNGPVLLSRNLSQLEIRALERFPEIQAKPRHVLDSLATALTTLDDVGDDAV